MREDFFTRGQTSLSNRFRLQAKITSTPLLSWNQHSFSSMPSFPSCSLPSANCSPHPYIKRWVRFGLHHCRSNNELCCSCGSPSLPFGHLLRRNCESLPKQRVQLINFRYIIIILIPTVTDTQLIITIPTLTLEATTTITLAVATMVTRRITTTRAPVVIFLFPHLTTSFRYRNYLLLLSLYQQQL